MSRWRADKAGLAFKAPPRHPFNPLTVLRLTIAKGSDRATVGTIFDHIWGTGHDDMDPQSMTALADKLGVSDLQAAIGDQAVKDTLRKNTEDAVAAGVYGVPNFLIDGQLFWGDDMFDMMLEWLNDPSILDHPEAKRITALEPAAERRR